MSRILGIPPKRALPLKEASLFKEVLTMYEARQLKKGLKTADQILKKFPEHGGERCGSQDVTVFIIVCRDDVHEGPHSHPHGSTGGRH